MCACHTRVVYSICRYLYRRNSHLVHANMGAQSFTPSYSNYTSVMKNCKSVPDSAMCEDSDDTFFMILARKLNLPIWIFEMWTQSFSRCFWCFVRFVWQRRGETKRAAGRPTNTSWRRKSNVVVVMHSLSPLCLGLLLRYTVRYGFVPSATSCTS